MRYYGAILCLLFFSVGGFAQDLVCEVAVDAQQTGRTQLSVFNTLRSAVQDFMNENTWGTQSLPREQRIRCNLFITIQQYDDNNFEASLQIQSSRPVYGSSMLTPIFNYRDNSFNFVYDENQPLRFNPNTFENNLVSTLSFYAYIILGLDADSFSLEGGIPFFDQADQIANIASQGAERGWDSSGNSRAELNRQLRSSTFQRFHEALYEYHRHGLDRMSEDVAEGKEHIVEAVNLLKELDEVRSNTLLIRSFFDAKANELAEILSNGPIVDLGSTVSNLQAIAPGHARLWNRIR